jgi:hypothetical protein
VIDAMTIGEVEELGRYWREYPPVHVSLAALIRAFAAPAPVDAPPDRAAPAAPAGAMPLAAALNLPGIGPLRPFAAAFGPGALEAMRAAQAHFDRSMGG